MNILERLSVEQKKQYNLLKSYYSEITGNEPKITFGGTTEELNNCCPAHVLSNDEIKLWDDLNGSDLIEAVAHEMMHIITRYQGLVMLDITDETEVDNNYGFPNRIKDFCMEVNNSVSHRILIPILKDKFAVSSEVQKIIRCKPLEEINRSLTSCNIPEIVEYKIVSHHIEGIIAYDISKCSFKDSNYVNQVIGISPEVKNSFDASSEFLSQIYLGQDIGVQIDLLKKFFEVLGYPASFFKILEPFPLIKTKSQIYCFNSHKE